MLEFINNYGRSLAGPNAGWLFIWLVVITVLLVIVWSTLAVSWGKYQIPVIGAHLSLNTAAGYR